MWQEPLNDGPEKKITRLAIGVEGGFNPDGGKKFEYEYIYGVVVLPSFASIPWPNTTFPDVVRKNMLPSLMDVCNKSMCSN